MIENVKELETKLGLAEGTLQEAIASDEAKSIELPKGSIVDTETHVIKTKEDHETFVGNLKEENKKIGVEMAVKEARSSLGLEFEGKTIDNLIKASNDKALSDAGKEPDAKIKELETDNEKLVNLNKGLQTKFDDEVNSNIKKEGKRSLDSKIIGHMDGEFMIAKDRMLTMFNSEHETSTEDGKTVIRKGGETLKNPDTMEPLTLESVVSDFSKEFVKPVDGGSGAGSTKGGEGTSIDNFTKRMKTNNINENSEAYNKKLAEEMTAGTVTV